MTTPRLAMSDVRKSFGATQALDGVSLELAGGEVLALLGENGAGKSTLMKILSGAHPPDSGAMRLDGRPFAPANPHDALAAGVAMIYQELILAPDLSIEDNIMLGQEVHRLGWLRRQEQRQRVRDVLGRLGHADLDPRTPVNRLSVGTQQLIEIARALILQARVIVLDEPTSSLTRQDTARLFAVLRSLRAQGIGIVYISHFLEEVREVAQSYTVLRDGRSVGRGRLDDVSEAELVRMMVDRDVCEMFPAVPHVRGDVLLRVEHLSGRPVPQDVCLEVHRGEILGIAGLVGAGRTEFLRCLFGLSEVTSGQVRIGGLALGGSARQRIRAGLGLVSEDRKGEGLAQQRSVADNLTYSRLAPYARWGWLDHARRTAAVEDWIRRLHIKSRGPSQPVSELSGGNQQKVALARVLHQQADILLLDEPTRGIDIGTKAEIYRLIGEQAAEGKSVLFVSSYFSELLAVCDRVAVMSRGRLREIRPAATWTEESLLACAIGTSG